MWTTEEVLTATSKLNWPEINRHLTGEFRKYSLPPYEMLTVTEITNMALKEYLMVDFVGSEDVVVEDLKIMGNLKSMVDLLVVKKGKAVVVDWKTTSKSREELDYLHDKEYNDLQWGVYLRLFGLVRDIEVNEAEFRFISHKDGILTPLYINLADKGTMNRYSENCGIMDQLINIGINGVNGEYPKYVNSCLRWKSPCQYWYLCRERERLGKEYDRLLEWLENYKIVKKEYSDSSLNLIQECPMKFKFHYALEELRGLIKESKVDVGFTIAEVEKLEKDDNKEGRLGSMIHYSIAYVYRGVKALLNESSD